jgi:1-deoxy-D-xylulose-5-phosphate synthase
VALACVASAFGRRWVACFPAAEAGLVEPRILSTIQGPSDLKPLDELALVQLCAEIRALIIETITSTGGHLAPSLGVVELTVALHRVFESPVDKIVWDVGHQCYAHKIICGRRESFARIRQRGGPSGFCRRDESPHDPFGAGHASTSISGALGIAIARDALKRDERVVAVIGDGGLSGGLAFEGLDNAGGCGRDFVVVLNDNNMSISPTVGALSHHLTDIITHPFYTRIKKDIWEFTEKLPKTNTVREIVRRVEGSLKTLLTPGLFFESLGFRYLGPIDGHDVRELVSVFEKVREMHGPVLVHVLTQKGRGLADAEEDPRRYHGIAPTVRSNGKTGSKTEGLSYTQVFGETLVGLAEQHPQLVAITAAMTDGTGLAPFARRYPERFFDVGIAEGHAVTFAAGLATQGMRPVVAIYSTFLQRAFDPLVHDVALQRLPVIFALDRAGLVGEDGATHHGAFDLSYLACIPGLVVAAPASGAELRDLLATALEYRDGPMAIRFPRAAVPDADALARPPQRLEIGRWEVQRSGPAAGLLAVGAMVAVAQRAAQQLAAEGIEVTVVNARFVRPVDHLRLYELAEALPLLVTIEENALAGGFGSLVALRLAEWGRWSEKSGRLITLGLPDGFVEHATREELLESVGLTAERVAERVAWGVREVRAVYAGA